MARHFPDDRDGDIPNRSPFQPPSHPCATIVTRLSSDPEISMLPSAFQVMRLTHRRCPLSVFSSAKRLPRASLKKNLLVRPYNASAQVMTVAATESDPRRDWEGGSRPGSCPLLVGTNAALCGSTSSAVSSRHCHTQ